MFFSVLPSCLRWAAVHLFCKDKSKYFTDQKYLRLFNTNLPTGLRRLSCSLAGALDATVPAQTRFSVAQIWYNCLGNGCPLPVTSMPTALYHLGQGLFFLVSMGWGRGEVGDECASFYRNNRKASRLLRKNKSI